MSTATHEPDCKGPNSPEGCTCGAARELGVEQRLEYAEHRVAELERERAELHATLREQAAKLDRQGELIAEARGLAELYRGEARNPAALPWEGE